MMNHTNSLSGYFVLGGNHSAITLPTFLDTNVHSLFSARTGKYCLDTNLAKGQTLSIPTRDKAVDVWASQQDYKTLSTVLATIDSDYPYLTYAQKLLTSEASRVDIGCIVNTSTDTHGSMAVIFGSRPLYVTGLYDTQLGTSYLLWSTEEDRMHRILSEHPLRFLIYRFPVQHSGCIFIQAEATCSKWFRWLKTNPSVLQAFNALEHRIYGPP